MVVHDHPPVAVQDFTARGQDRNGFDAVLQRALLVDFRVANLQVPKAGDQEQKDGHGHVLKERDLGRGDFGIVAQQLVGALPVFAPEMKFHSCIPSSARHL